MGGAPLKTTTCDCTAREPKLKHRGLASLDVCSHTGCLTSPGPPYERAPTTLPPQLMQQWEFSAGAQATEATEQSSLPAPAKPDSLVCLLTWGCCSSREAF